MPPSASEAPRRIRFAAYVYCFLFCSLIVFLSHLWLIRLPYYWDEAGQFVPAALDILRGGAWIPHSAPPNIHPPAIMAYLAAFWSLAGFSPVATRAAMLLLASFALLSAFLLAIELSKEASGAPAFLAAGLLAASPLFFAQAMLAQLDATAMLFTVVALLLFLQDHIRLSAAACVALVLVKETGIVVPLVLALWLAHEGRWRGAAWFAAPAVALSLWMTILFRATGHWMGSPGFVEYNLSYPLHPVRFAVALLRRVYYVFFAGFHWLGTLAILAAWRKSHLFQSRSWRVAWLLVAAQMVLVSMTGGAVLERYLLPVMPIVYTAMVAGLSLYRRLPGAVFSGLLLAGVLASNFINPPYPFPYEDNLAFSDFVKLQADAADYLAHWYSQARVDTMWPLTAELTHPDLGFVSQPIAVRLLHNISAQSLESMNWDEVQVLVAFSRTWDPQFNLMRYAPFREFWQRFFPAVPNASMEAVRARIPFPIVAHFERRGQWADIYVNPVTPLTPPSRTRTARMR